MKPASASMVTACGSICKSSLGKPEPWSVIWSASAAPNSRHAAAAPSGYHLPTIIAASAM